MMDSTEMKLRWLARRLRWTDKPGEIEQWFNVVSSLNSLRLSFKISVTSSPNQNTEQTQRPCSERKRFTHSNPHKINWESNDVINTAQADTPIPVNVCDVWHNSPAKEKSSSTYDACLPPCVELEEPPRENVPDEMKDSSMDVDKWSVESVPVLNNDRENRILKDNPGDLSSKQFSGCGSASRQSSRKKVKVTNFKIKLSMINC